MDTNGNSYDEFFNKKMSPRPTPTPTEENDDLDEEGIYQRIFKTPFSELRQENKTVLRLHVVDTQGVLHTFQNAHLIGGTFRVVGTGQQYTLDFATPDGVIRVTVDGTNIIKSYEYCQLHRWSVLRADDDNGRGFTKAKPPTIDSISIDPVEEEQKPH